MGLLSRSNRSHDVVRSQHVKNKRPDRHTSDAAGDVPRVRKAVESKSAAVQFRIAQTEGLTSKHRQLCAREHSFKARQHRLESARQRRRQRIYKKLAYASHVVAQAKQVELACNRSQNWHEGRASGQLARHKDAAHCGEGTLTVSCACGSAVQLPVRCGVTRLCVVCREHRAQKRRAQLWSARKIILADLKQRQLWGRYGEKHLVLTMPDSRIEGTKRRIEILFEAWRRFSRRLQKHVKNWDTFIYSRTFEWTPGRDLKGHPHFHVWMISRYIDKQLLWDWWQRSLASCGVQLKPTDTHAVYVRDVELNYAIREVHKGGKAYKYASLKSTELLTVEYFLSAVEVANDSYPVLTGVVKESNDEGTSSHLLRNYKTRAADVIGYVESWSVAESKGGEGASLQTIADVYEALEGKRQNQTSSGLMSMAPAEWVCSDCGSTECNVSVQQWWSRQE